MKEFLSVPKIPTMELVHEDPRRRIGEVVLERYNGSKRRVTRIEVNDPEPGEQIVLGNHTHERTEDFAILSGNPTVYTANLENPNDITEHLFPEGGHISIEEGKLHAFVFKKQRGVVVSTMTGSTFEESGTKPHKFV